MPVLTNTMLQGSSADTEEAAFQIEKSCRFNEYDDASLKTYQFKGNQKRWTYSTWIKRADVSVGNALSTRWLFGFENHASNTAQIYFQSDYIICYFYNGGHVINKRTEWAARDPSAWLHFVFAIDTTHETAFERAKLYVNGVELEYFTSTDATQYVATEANQADCVHYIGAASNGDGTPYGHTDALFSDIHFIDGLQLTPQCFGEWDSTGVWIPKAYLPRKANNGTTWSDGTKSGSVANASGDTGWVQGFDGDAGTLVYASDNNSISEINLGGDDGIPFNKLEMNIGKHGTDGTHVYINDVIIDDALVEFGVAGSWKDVSKVVKSPLKKIGFKNVSGSSSNLKAVKVDGDLLIDGVNHGVDGYRRNPNDGTKWSDGVSLSGGGYDSGFEQPKGFDNEFNTYIRNGTAGVTLTFTPPTPITYTKGIRIFTDRSHTTLTFNGSGVTAPGAAGWHQVVTGSGTFTSLALTKTADSSTLGAVEVDGFILIDEARDNSYHLEFNDTNVASHNRYIGKDTLHGKISDCTGGLPIYNTDATGDVKGSGYRTDSSAGTTDGTGLVFALPGDVLTDVHHNINTGSSQVTVANNNNVAVSNDDSRLYGSSLWFPNGGSGDYLKTTSANSDFTFGTGNFTIEFWAKNTGNANGGLFQFTDQEGLETDYIIAMVWSNSNQIETYVYKAAGGFNGFYGTAQDVKLNKWTHIAFQRTGSTTYTLYIDGVLKDTFTSTANETLSPTYLNIGAYYNNTKEYEGYIQDFRVYKGVVKYTSNFVAANRNDFIVNNIAAGDTSTAWSQGLTSSNDPWGDVDSGPWGQRWKGFNGQLDNDMAYDGDGGGTTLAWTNPKGNNQTSIGSGIRVFPRASGGGSRTFTLNGDETTTLAANGWTTIDVGNETYLNSFTITGGEAYLSAIEVNGKILVDPTQHDILVDTPTNGGTDTGLGGQVTGNYAVWQTLNEHFTQESGTRIFRNGATYHSDTGASGSGGAITTMATGTTGKWYAEISFSPSEATNWYTNTEKDGGRFTGNEYLGIIPVAEWNKEPRPDLYRVKDFHGIKCDTANTKATNVRGDGGGGDTTTELANDTAWAVNDVIGISIDLDTPAVKFYKNGVAIGTFSYTIPSGKEWLIGTSDWHSYAGPIAFMINTGQAPFAFPLAGHKCICSTNLDDTFGEDDKNDPSKYFDAQIYTGTGATNQYIRNLDFTPELVIFKKRNSSRSFAIFDAARGVEKRLQLDENVAQDDSSTGLKTFEPNGFSFGNNSANGDDGDTYVAWAWDCGTAAATASTDGSITPSAQWVNATAGFSISVYTGTGSNATIGHGLSAKPGMHIIKRTNSTADWRMYLDNPLTATHSLIPSETSAKFTVDTYQDTEPTNTVISLDGDANVNASGDTYVLYCWTPIKGFSSFGGYLGTGDTSGLAVYTGFRPRFVWTKAVDSTGGWAMYDTARLDYNRMDKEGRVVESQAATGEQNDADIGIDILSNGFRPYSNWNPTNTSDNKMYIAFAEFPFKTTRAR